MVPYAGRYSMQARLVGACAVLLGISLWLCVFLLFMLFHEYQTTKRSHAALELYEEVLKSGTAISAERGPTNSLLGFDGTSSVDVDRLRKFRAASDQSLAHITEMNKRLKDFASPGDLDRVRTVLVAARQQVDAVIALPLPSRTDIQGAIAGMFQAVDVLRPLIDAAALHSIERDKGLADEAQIGQKLFEIRDYAGRLGSIMTPFIATHQRITPDQEDSLQQARGRMQQLWELTKPYLLRYPELSRQVQNAQDGYFAKMPVTIDKIMDEVKTGQYTMSTKSMTDLIVPTFAPLERLRDDYIRLMIAQADARLSSSFRWLLIAGAGTLLIIFINVLLLASIQRMIFHPLLRARNSVILLAEEKDLETESGAPDCGIEVAELFQAIGLLKIKLLERRDLTDQLRLQASCDGLTGLLNRRSLDQIGNGDSEFKSIPPNIGLIVMDIDKFKSINDSYGHVAGDTVIQTVAATVRANVRKDDLVARYGGEEFAVIVPDATLEQTLKIAELLRSAVADKMIDIGQGKIISVTASFGVAAGQRGMDTWCGLMKAADAALYAAKVAGRNQVCSGDFTNDEGNSPSDAVAV